MNNTVIKVSEPSHPARLKASFVAAVVIGLLFTSCQQVGEGIGKVGNAAKKSFESLQDGIEQGSSGNDRRSNSTGSSPGLFTQLFPGDKGRLIDALVAMSYGASGQQSQQAASKASRFRSDSGAKKKFAAAKSKGKARYVAVEVKKDSSKGSEGGKHVMLVNPETGKPKSNKVFVAKNAKSGSLVKIDGSTAMMYN